MKTDYDVIVAGGGAAGIAAASAARGQGARTLLIESLPFLGGMATAAEVGTICGLYLRSEDPEPIVACPGFPYEFCQKLGQRSGAIPILWKKGLRFLPYDPQIFSTLALETLRSRNVEVSLGSRLTRAYQSGDNWRLDVTTRHTTMRCSAHTVVDCTGDAEVSRVAGLPCKESIERQAGAIVFTLSPVTHYSAAKLQVLHALAEGIAGGDLPRECERLSVIPPTGQSPRELRCKLGLLPKWSAGIRERAEEEARRLIGLLVPYLLKNVEPLKEADLTRIAAQVGIRSGAIPQGRHTVTEAEILATTLPDDSVSLGAWPIEFWGEAREPLMKYLPERGFYGIPARALESTVSDTLFFAGKSFSAEERALASARVIGTCLSTGYAAGTLAAAKALHRSRETAIKQLTSEQCRLLHIPAEHR